MINMRSAFTRNSLGSEIWIGRLPQTDYVRGLQRPAMAYLGYCRGCSPRFVSEAVPPRGIRPDMRNAPPSGPEGGALAWGSGAEAALRRRGVRGPTGVVGVV